MDNYESIDVEHQLVTARAGAHIFDAVREAIALAVTENHIVILAFNDKQYKIDPRQLTKVVMGEA